MTEDIAAASIKTSTLYKKQETFRQKNAKQNDMGRKKDNPIYFYIAEKGHSHKL